MGFFDDVPAAEPEPPRRHHPWEPPEAEFPGVVPTGALLLGRTEQAAVAITALTAFSNGFEIYLTARFRRPAPATMARRPGRGPPVVPVRDAAARRDKGRRRPRPEGPAARWSGQSSLRAPS